MERRPRLTLTEYIEKLRVILAAQRTQPHNAVYWQGQRRKLETWWQQQERRDASA